VESVPGVIVEGPLSFDVALDAEAAREKGVGGEVAGRANILVGSTVEVSNGIYTALTLLPKARSAGVVVGGSVPLAFPFPSDGVEAAVNSVCLAALLALQNAQ
jgi:phosphotransacetylase